MICAKVNGINSRIIPIESIFSSGLVSSARNFKNIFLPPMGEKKLMWGGGGGGEVCVYVHNMQAMWV